MNKIKFTISIILLTSLLVVLVGCGSVDYNFENVFNMWKQEQTISTDCADMVCSVAITDGTVLTEDYNYPRDAISLSKGQSITYTVNMAQAGKYNLSIDYYLLHNGLSDSELQIDINQKTALTRAPLKALWTTSNQQFAKDSFGNEIVPGQSKATMWQSTQLYLYNYSTALPVTFDLSSGENTIKITLVSGGDTLIGDFFVKSTRTLTSYLDYYQQNINKPSPSVSKLIEAERPLYKNDSSIIATYSADINVTPYDTYTSKLNTIASFNTSTQTIYYQLDVPTSGNYLIAFNYLVDNANRTTFTTIAIDNQVPFGELLHYPLVSNNQYDIHILGNDNPFFIYLTEGTHTLSIKIDGSLVSTQSEQIKDVVSRINDIYLDLKKIAGAANDPNREWNPDTDFPGVTQSLTSIRDELFAIKNELTAINCADVNYQGIIYLEAAIKAIDGLLKKPMLIPNNYQQLSEGSGSIVQTIANALLDIQTTPLSLDKIFLFSSTSGMDVERNGVFFKFWEGVKKFFYSFTADYSNVTEEEKTIQVWVARSRQYVDLMQQMIDTSDFYEQTGYKVKFSILANEGKLILSNIAGIQPNVVMGISNWLPYEMGIRDLTYDLTQFDDYGQVIDSFSEGAMIPLIADGIGLGLPETQDFYVMYYRSDIMDKYNIPLPNTWEEVIEILPELQRYGLNFYVPLSSSTSSKSIMTTAPFIYQYGGSLFSAEATTTTIDDEQSLQAIKLMTELYTLYALPQQVNNFFDSFRNGSLPIGISTFDTFVKLSFAAPEIAGQWSIALAPGVYNEQSGVVERWQTGSSSSVALLKSDDDQLNNAGWELLKWWVSQSTQTDFMNRLTMIYGKNYIWNSANLSAFNNSISFTQQHKEVILEQWEWMREIPKVPGWYMLERELSNAWNSIVINGENTRAVIEDAVGRINKELSRKLTEFDYMQDGVLVKPYVITTLEYVRSLKE